MTPGAITRKQVVVGICLLVGALHFVTGPAYGGPWRGFVNGYLMDILVPFAMYLLLGVSGLAAARSPLTRGITVFVIGCAVELLQYLGVPLFGATFDAMDLVMYAAGVAGGVLVEAVGIARLTTVSAARVPPDAARPADER